jgi:hypothetical protein
MPLQLTNYKDAFNRTNPAAYLKVMSGNWDARTGSVQVQVSVWADKAAYDAGARSLWDFSEKVAVDPTSLQSAVETQIAKDPSIAPLSPTTVA